MSSCGVPCGMVWQRFQREAGHCAGRVLAGGDGVDEDRALEAYQPLHQAQPSQSQAVYLKIDSPFGFRLQALLHLLGDAPAHTIVTQDGITQADDQGFRLGRASLLRLALPSLKP